jgi:hypothetical protein
MTSRFRLSTAAAVAPLLLMVSLILGAMTAGAETTPDPEIVKRFEFLSQNGNSSCSRAFRDSIAEMPASAQLQGSCCGPMILYRYSEQIEGLKQYSHIADVPPDPYNVPAPLAQKLIADYQESLSAEQQEHYDIALDRSNENGPCCCRCWRWDVFGGLGKLLIREHGFTGEQVAQIWNLSDACGGDAHLHN